MLQHFSDFFVLRIAGLVRLFYFKGFTLKPEGIIDRPQHGRWRNYEKAAVNSTAAVFIVERIRPEQRRLVGKPHLAGGRESVEAGDRCRHSARRGGKRTRPASEAKKRLDYGRVLQKASVEGRRRGDRADGQLSL